MEKKFLLEQLQANGFASVKANTRNLIDIMWSIAKELNTKLCLEKVGEERLLFLYETAFYKEKFTYLRYVADECVGDVEDKHHIPMSFDTWMQDKYIIVK